MATNQPPTPAQVPNPAELLERSQTFAAEAYKTVGDQYLEFRRQYYHDPAPSLATEPPITNDVQRTEVARLGANTLNVVPGAVRNIPLVHDLLGHLQKMVDIQSLTADERTQLHNITMTFLYGVKGGVQPWFVTWLLDAEHRLQTITQDDYYVHYPWQGLMARTPEELAVFDSAVRGGDIIAIEREVGRYGDALVEVLRNPVDSQFNLAFSGPNGERKKLVFNLKTSAGLAIGAYLAVEAVQELMGGKHQNVTPPSVVQPPAEILANRTIPAPNTPPNTPQ